MFSSRSVNRLFKAIDKRLQQMVDNLFAFVFFSVFALLVAFFALCFLLAIVK